MTNRITGIFFLIAIIAGIFISCKHDIPVVEPVIPPATPTICFESDVLPLFQSNCAKSGCHDAATASDGYVLDNFANIISRGIIAGDSSGSAIYKALTGNGVERMPQEPNNPLTAAQVHTIAKWISEGATNTTNCEATCDSSQFAYSANVKPILETNCLGCHSGSATDGGFIPLDTYDGIKSVVDADLLLPAITHTGSNPMPKNGNKLSDCKIAIIRKWIEAGAPNN
jgi:hypothetical protein